MADQLIKAIDEMGAFRFCVMDSTQMVEKMRQIHQPTPTATAALGRLLTMCAILGSDRKQDDETLTVLFQGDGPGGTCVAVCDEPHAVRCSAQSYDVELPLKADGHLDVGAYIGTGTMSVIRGAKGKDPFIGTTTIETGEIAEDFAFYFYRSEQIPTVVMLGVLIAPDGHVMVAGGLFIQALPSASAEECNALQDLVEHLPPITTMLQHHSPKQILEEEFVPYHVDLLAEEVFEYHCPCSKQRMERALYSLPRADVQELIEEDHGCEIHCEFCETNYTFSEEELRDIVQGGCCE